MLKIAVALSDMTGEVGEFLADATALEAAGADAIWVEDSGPEPWVMLGALAAVTHRVGLGCMIAAPEKWPASRLGPATAMLQTLSRGRVVVGLPRNGVGDDQLEVLRSSGVKILGGNSDALSTDGELWAAIACPPDRDAWNATLAAYEAEGAVGVIVSWDARLIDLLRNPEPDDRSDLLMSTG